MGGAQAAFDGLSLAVDVWHHSPASEHLVIVWFMQISQENAND
ncbi:hypothetical protein [Limnohabitans sp. Jir72]|nr:hypothetical protein [Limnohabitans sp. Jir72]